MGRHGKCQNIIIGGVRLWLVKREEYWCRENARKSQGGSSGEEQEEGEA